MGGEFTYRFVADQAGSSGTTRTRSRIPRWPVACSGRSMVTPKSGIAQSLGCAGACSYVRRRAHRQRQGRGSAGAGTPGSAGPGPGNQHRQRAHGGAGRAARTGYWRLMAATYTDHPEVSGRSLTLTAGARADLEVQVPADGSAARIQLSKAIAVIVGPSGSNAPAPPPQPGEKLDLLTYRDTGAPLRSLDPARPTRRFDYVIGRRPGFVRAVGRECGGRSTATSIQTSRCSWCARATWS